MAEPLLLSQADAARALAISVRTLFSLLDRGEIPRIKIGARVLISCGDLELFIERKKNTPVATGAKESTDDDASI
jgi:excisionase family DNA binding protein